MAGRAGTYDKATETWSDVIYMPCTAENNFAPDFPSEVPDIIYLASLTIQPDQQSQKTSYRDG